MKLQTRIGSGPGGVSRRAVQPLEVWAGLECTVARIGDQYRDLLAETGRRIARRGFERKPQVIVPGSPA